MIDFGWPELLVIIVVAVFVIGPKEIPQIMYGLGRLFRRFQYIKFAFTRQFDEFMEQVDVEDIRQGINTNANIKMAERPNADKEQADNEDNTDEDKKDQETGGRRTG